MEKKKLKNLSDIITMFQELEEKCGDLEIDTMIQADVWRSDDDVVIKFQFDLLDTSYGSVNILSRYFGKMQKNGVTAN